MSDGARVQFDDGIHTVTTNSGGVYNRRERSRSISIRGESLSRQGSKDLDLEDDTGFDKRDIHQKQVSGSRMISRNPTDFFAGLQRLVSSLVSVTQRFRIFHTHTCVLGWHSSLLVSSMAILEPVLSMSIPRHSAASPATMTSSARFP